MTELTGTILVTGGMGFIGSNFVRHVLREHPAARIVNLDKVTYAGNPRNLADLAEEPRYVFVQADIRDGEALAKALTAHGVDQIVHFAAETHVDRSILGAGDFIRTNVEGTQVLLDAARAAGVRRFLAHLHRRGVRGAGQLRRFRRGVADPPQQPLRRQQGRGGRSGPSLPRDLRPSGHHHPDLQQLRAVPVPREVHPPDDRERLPGRAAAHLRRRALCARVAPRRGPLPRPGPGPGGGAARRGVQHRQRGGADEPGGGAGDPAPHGEARDAPDVT